MGQAIYWAKVEDVTGLIGGITWPPDQTLMILERLLVRWLSEEEIKSGLRFETFKPDEPFSRWERGRIFHPEGELRWEKIDHRFWVVYVGSDQVTLPETFKRDESLQLGQPVDRSYYLWGKRINKEALKTLNRPANAPIFAEFTVGGILAEYPVDVPVDQSPKHLKLDVAEYIDPKTQALQYYRFKGVSWQ